MTWKQSNFAQMTLLQSCQASDLTIYVSTTDAALLPTLGVGDKAKLVLMDGRYREILNITANSSGTLTVERGKETTSARAWPAGTIAIHTPTAEIIQNVLNVTTVTKYTGTVSNVNDAYTVNVGVGGNLPTYSNGDEAYFIINASNPGAAGVTLAFTDGTTTTATKSVLSSGQVALDKADFKANYFVLARYSQTAGAWLLVSRTSLNSEEYQLNDGPITAINRVPNGKPDNWKNGTSFSTPSSTTETADNWYLDYDGSIGTFTVSQQSFTLGDTTIDDSHRYFIRWDQTVAGSASTKRRFKLSMPDVTWRQGQKVSLGLWMKAEAAHTVTCRISQNFGTGGSPSAEVSVATLACNLTTSWQKFTLEGQVLTSITGKTLGSNADDALILYIELPVNTVQTIDICGVDLRQGNQAGVDDNTYPVPWWRGGIGGSYTNREAFLTNMLLSSVLADLSVIEALAGTSGILAKTAANAWALRTLTAPASGITVSNGTGAGGNPTLALANDLAAVEGFAGSDTTGLPYRSGVDTWASVTFGANLSFAAGVLGGTLGTAALVNDGTSGGTYGKLNANKTDSGNNTFTGTNAFAGAFAGSLGLTLNATDSFGIKLRLQDNSVTRGYIGADATYSQIFYNSSGVQTFGFRNADGVGVFLGRPTFNGNTALDTANGAQLATSNTFTAAQRITMATPVWVLRDTGGAADAKVWREYATGSNHVYDCLNDAENSATSWLTVARSGQTPQSATFGCDVVLPSTGPTSTLSAGYRGAPNTGSPNTAYTMVLADAAGTLYHDEVTARTWTIPANASVAFPIGTTIILDNTGNSGAAGTITLQITTDTLRRGDGVAGTGTRTIAANQVAVIRKTKSGEWVITGSFT